VLSPTASKETWSKPVSFFLLPIGIPEGLEAIRLRYADKAQLPTEETEREWRSFRSLPRGNMGGFLKPAEK